MCKFLTFCFNFCSQIFIGWICSIVSSGFFWVLPDSSIVTMSKMVTMMLYYKEQTFCTLIWMHVIWAVKLSWLDTFMLCINCFFFQFCNTKIIALQLLLDFSKYLTTDIILDRVVPYMVEVNSIQNYVIKFVSDLRQVGGFLRLLRFPPPIKLTSRI
jgi:hypothetical protein